jgi:predicted membrane protein
MSWGRLFFGGLVLAVGIVLLLGNADLVDAGEVFGTWWPVVLIFAGVLSLMANPRHWGIAGVIILAGVVFLLARLDVVDLRDLVIPAALILIGIFVIFGRGIANRQETTDRVNSFNVFSGSELTSRSSAFEGGSITAVFGGTELDLRQARLAPGATLDIFAAFAGVEMRVPPDWHVVVKGLPIFGGIENGTGRTQLPDNAPTLEINATVLFGGVEIKS